MAIKIKLKVHSHTKGAEGHIGDVVDAEDKAAEYLLGLDAAVVWPPKQAEPEPAEESGEGQAEEGAEEQDDTESENSERPRRNRRNRRA